MLAPWFRSNISSKPLRPAPLPEGNRVQIPSEPHIQLFKLPPSSDRRWLKPQGRGFTLRPTKLVTILKPPFDDQACLFVTENIDHFFLPFSFSSIISPHSRNLFLRHLNRNTQWYHIIGMISFMTILWAKLNAGLPIFSLYILIYSAEGVTNSPGNNLTGHFLPKFWHILPRNIFKGNLTSQLC